MPSWFAWLVLVALVGLAFAGGYAVRGALSGWQNGRLAELDQIESLRRSKAEGPDDFSSRLELANTLNESGRPYSALAEYDAVLLKNPNDIAALYGRGKVLLALGRDAEGESSLWKVFEQDKTHVGAAEALGDYYASKKRYESLIEAVEPVVAEHPSEGRLQYLMGLAYENTGRRDLAETRYLLALNAVPDMPEARAGLARVRGAQ